jgi:hypothetical protein
MTDWKTYQNLAAGFSLTYPPNWSHEEDPSGSIVIFTAKDKGGEFLLKFVLQLVSSKFKISQIPFIITKIFPLILLCTKRSKLLLLSTKNPFQIKSF